MKLIILFTFISGSVLATERDCLKESHEFKLADKITNIWSSELGYGEQSIAQICARDEGDIEVTIYLNKIIEKKVKAELYIKHTMTMGTEDSDAYFEELEGEISNEELCKELDKYKKKIDSCSTPVTFLNSINNLEYKDYKVMCLQKLPELQKRIASCRK